MRVNVADTGVEVEIESLDELNHIHLTPGASVVVRRPADPFSSRDLEALPLDGTTTVELIHGALLMTGNRS